MKSYEFPLRKNTTPRQPQQQDIEAIYERVL
jgi:hypothetical protein